MKTKFEDGMDELVIIGGESNSKMIHHTKVIRNVYKVYLDEDIGSPSKYRDLITLLSDATEDDEIHLLINSNGGRADSAMALIELIKNADADVTAIILGGCHSAASLIALSCKMIGVTDSASMLVHTGSYGLDGNNHNVRRHVDFAHKQINDLIDSAYSGFLTDQELKDVKSGVEFWFNANEIRKRLKSRNKWLSSRNQKRSPSETVDD